MSKSALNQQCTNKNIEIVNSSAMNSKSEGVIFIGKKRKNKKLCQNEGSVLL
jgi:hypothetical protein